MLKCLKALKERPEKQLNQVENMKKINVNNVVYFFNRLSAIFYM